MSYALVSLGKTQAAVLCEAPLDTLKDVTTGKESGSVGKVKVSNYISCKIMAQVLGCGSLAR